MLHVVKKMPEMKNQKQRQVKPERIETQKRTDKETLKNSQARRIKTVVSCLLITLGILGNFGTLGILTRLQL